jgi:hypothetical protein
MKKILLLSVLLGMAWVPASQAVVISWYAETSGLTYSSAQLVYVESGSWGSYVKVGDLATGSYAIPGGGVTEQSASDNVTRTQGAYYVVLFSDAGGLTEAYRSTAFIAYDDTALNAITRDIWNPATGFFAPSGGLNSGWQQIPEPSTFALLAVGAAVLAWKRHKRG